MTFRTRKRRFSYGTGLGWYSVQGRGVFCTDQVSDDILYKEEAFFVRDAQSQEDQHSARKTIAVRATWDSQGISRTGLDGKGRDCVFLLRDGF